jgi:hypothetical protein
VNATVHSNIFRTNYGRYAVGGVYILAGELVTISNNLFEGNCTNGGSGALGIGGRRIIVSDNLFRFNSADEAGAIGMGDGEIFLSNNTVISNSANTGSGVMIYSGIITAQNDVISSNPSSWEGVRIVGGSLHAQHWTVAGNGHYGIFNDGGTVVITNTIITSHTVAGIQETDVRATRTLFFGNGVQCCKFQLSNQRGSSVKISMGG